MLIIIALIYYILLNIYSKLNIYYIVKHLYFIKQLIYNIALLLRSFPTFLIVSFLLF